jgi:predicted flavoprotein YhiN
MSRYGEQRCTALAARWSPRSAAPQLRVPGPRRWGWKPFIGSSGRVFPKDMKAAPLLRAWLHRLRNGSGVEVLYAPSLARLGG